MYDFIALVEEEPHILVPKIIRAKSWFEAMEKARLTYGNKLYEIKVVAKTYFYRTTSVEESVDLVKKILEKIAEYIEENKTLYSAQIIITINPRRNYDLRVPAHLELYRGEIRIFYDNDGVTIMADPTLNFKPP